MHLPETFAQAARHAADGTAGADARYEGVDAPSELFDELARGARVVALRICRILKLARHESAGRLPDELLRAAHGGDHSVRGRRQRNLGSIGTHDMAPFEAHVLGHHEDATIASHGGDHREADTGVATRRLDDRGSRSEP